MSNPTNQQQRLAGFTWLHEQSPHHNDISTVSNVDDDGFEVVGAKKGKRNQNHVHFDKKPRLSRNNNHQNQNNKLMILLVGIPGSGKSTFADNLVSTNPNKFVRINQDILKTRKKCEQRCRQALQHGKTVIIDRVNFDKEQRKHFIDIAMEFNSMCIHDNDVSVSCPIDCIIFDYPMEVCISRCVERTNHETLKDEGLIRQVVPRMYRSLDVPSQHVQQQQESFRNVIVVNSFDQANDIVQKYAQDYWNS
jgi:predicted kinase